MELQLIRSFLSVAESGSFAAASEKLFVTQSAVSLRIQRLEDQLGQPLFTRSKDGVTLTPAGREFRSFALTIHRNWEQARQRLASYEADQSSLTIGAHQSLWPRFGFRWLDALRGEMPDLKLRAEMGRSDALSQMLLSGTAQVVLGYAPLTQSGVVSEPLMEEQLVLVASWPEARLDGLEGRYILADWGRDFLRFHEEQLPLLHNAGISFGLGALTLRYLLSRPYAAYLPAHLIKRYVDSDQLHLVADAPVFTHPAWVIWREDLSPELRDVARKTLETVVEGAETDSNDMLDQL